MDILKFLTDNSINDNPKITWGTSDGHDFYLSDDEKVIYTSTMRDVLNEIFSNHGIQEDSP